MLELGGPAGGTLVGAEASTEASELLTYPRYYRTS